MGYNKTNETNRITKSFNKQNVADNKLLLTYNLAQFAKFDGFPNEVYNVK